MMTPAFLLATAPIQAADLNVGGELLRVSASLIGIIMLILAAGWLSRRMQRRTGTGGARRIRCVETFSVGTRDRLLLLDADGKRLLIGIGQGGMHTLHVYDQLPANDASTESDATAGTLPAGTPFSELLARWTSRA